MNLGHAAPSHPPETQAASRGSGEPSQSGIPLAALRDRVHQVADHLGKSLRAVADSLGAQDLGPQRLADHLGLDKVLASRFLGALRAPDAMSTLHRLPGPAPLRRVVAAASRAGAPTDVSARAADAIDAYDHLVRSVGDQSSLDSIMSAWVPEAKRDFQVRRRQAAHRAISQLHGVEAGVLAETGLIVPNEDGQTIDVIWCKSLVGLRRLTPGRRTRLSSVRHVAGGPKRHPTTLDGRPIDSVVSAMLPDFSSPHDLSLVTESVGETTHYLVGDDELPIGTPCTLTTCEVNRSDLPRYKPSEEGRRVWMSSEVALPSRKLQFDLLTHPDLFADRTPRLDVYDTAIRGHVDPNDRSRSIDRLDLNEDLEERAAGLDGLNASAIPDHRRLIETVCQTLGVDGSGLHILRVSSSYPLYGSQYVISFGTVDPPLG